MSGEWVQPVLTAAGVAVPGVLGLLAYGLHKRAQRTTERGQKHERDDAAFERMKSLAEILQAERNRGDVQYEKALARIERLELQRAADRQVIDADRDELEVMQRSLSEMQSQLNKVKRWLDRTLGYLRSMLLWAEQVEHSTPHPAPPDDIAHLIDTRDKP